MEFLILGSFEVRRDGAVVDVSGAKARAVLAMLVLHANEPVSAERLAIALWGKEVPGAAVNAVQAHVSRVRRALGADGVLATTPGGYCLQVDLDAIDARRFECLLAQGDHDTALALWRGPALVDFAGSEFAQAEIARLEELREEAIEARIDCALAAGRHRQLVGELERRVADQPLRERAHAQLMLALAGSGRRAEALAVYRRARATLVEELGLEPGAQLREIERTLLAEEDVRGAVVPEPPTPTFGRAIDLQRLEALLVAQRLVTIVGPGGVGKTRLAVDAARRAAGASFVSLASVANAADVPGAILHALNVVPAPGESAEAALVRHLARREQLLVLDNLEHILDASAIIPPLLESCSGLTVLATSREPLRLRAERLFRAKPLTLDAAVEQFVSLVAARDLGAGDMAAAKEICQRLDGLPLAIELAAGRVGVLSVVALAERLRSGLDALGPGPRDAPPRQRTLTATLQWSYDLATPQEQSALCALAVFAGGCTVEAAEAVTRAPLEILEALADKHLVLSRDGRVGLLETVREFALARLENNDGAHGRHCEYYLGLAERTRPELSLRNASGPMFEAVHAERDNFRAALTWAAGAGRHEDLLALVGALDYYWLNTNADTEAHAWYERALADAPASAPTAQLARAHLGYARLRRDGSHRATDEASTALELYRRIGDDAGIADTLIRLSAARSMNAEMPTAYALAESAWHHARAARDEPLAAYARMRMAIANPDIDQSLAVPDDAVDVLRRAGSHYRIAETLAVLAWMALVQERYREAHPLLDDARSAALESGTPYALALVEGNRGLLALLCDRVEDATACFREQLRIAHAHGLITFYDEAFLGLAAVAAHHRRDELAAALQTASSEQTQTPVAVSEQPVYDRVTARYLEPARTRLGAEHWQNAAAAGHGLTEADAIELALRSGVAQNPLEIGPTPRTRTGTPRADRRRNSR